MNSTYRTVTEVTNFGPYVTKIIIPLPGTVKSADLSPDTFNVFVERRDKTTGEVLILRKDWFSTECLPSRGYCKVSGTYAADNEGERAETGKYAVLELEYGPASRLNSAIAEIKHNTFVFNDFRVTQVKEIATEREPIAGLVFDTCSANRMDQLRGWVHSRSAYAPVPLNYGFFVPLTGSGRRPLIIWLHGAGEGGQDPMVAYAGNKVVGLSSDKVQSYFGGAYVLAPQVPTMWMDDGSGEYTESGRTIYAEALKALIDEFISLHADIDPDRVYIGGCSNGGFMTMRMIIDYPGFFAAAYPVCEALYDKTVSDDNIEAIKNTPIWFTHAVNDPIVKPEQMSIPTYHRLVAAGAPNIHFSLFDKVVDTTGLFKNEDGSPFEFFGHATWIYMLNDECRLDFDGSPVVVDGHEVTLLQWLALQSR